MISGGIIKKRRWWINKRVCFLSGYVLFLSLITSPLSLAEESKSCPGEEMFSFASSLFDEGEYYRAITEYKRFIFCYPIHLLVEEAWYRIGLCYLKGKKEDKAIEIFKRVVEKYPHSEIKIQARFKIAESLYEKGEFCLSVEEMERILSLLPKKEWCERIYYAIAWSHLNAFNLEEAKTALSCINSNGSLSLTSQALLSDLEGAKPLPVKSPVVAGVLSTILPGAGQLYTGRLKDSFITFCLNAVFIAAIAKSVENENYGESGILSLFEIGWYAGNIYNAISDAHKVNRSNNRDFLLELLREYPAPF